MGTEEISLTVNRHRGHQYDWSHPRNLLDIKDTWSQYHSISPSFGDWIIFKSESPFIVIPKAVIIRNYGSGYGNGLKSISLSLSVDGVEFEDFAVIQDIDRWTNKEQYFN